MEIELPDIIAIWVTKEASNINAEYIERGKTPFIHKMEMPNHLIKEALSMDDVYGDKDAYDEIAGALLSILDNDYGLYYKTPSKFLHSHDKTKTVPVNTVKRHRRLETVDKPLCKSIMEQCLGQYLFEETELEIKIPNPKQNKVFEGEMKFIKRFGIKISDLEKFDEDAEYNKLIWSYLKHLELNT